MVIYFFILIFSLTLIYASGSELQEFRYLEKYGVKTKAFVITNKQSFERPTNMELYDQNSLPESYIAVYEFKDQKGESHLAINDQDRSLEKRKIGAKKEIIYDPEDPRHYLLDYHGRKELMTMILIFGILMLLVSAYLIIDKI